MLVKTIDNRRLGKDMESIHWQKACQDLLGHLKRNNLDEVNVGFDATCEETGKEYTMKLSFSKKQCL